jgi:hypothetical protein
MCICGILYFKLNGIDVYQYIIDLVIIKNLDPKMVFIIYALEKGTYYNSTKTFLKLISIKISNTFVMFGGRVFQQTAQWDR